MINIIDKKDCCGCSACVQRCPKHCISMIEDNEGFLYPNVDSSLCINCGLCEKVCPVINQNESRSPLEVYAAKNLDDNVRFKSSSGGIFTMLAEYTIQNGGIVFGARWDKKNWNVIHDYTETIDGLSEFRSSKYLQSIIGNSFKQAEAFLKQGRDVLFTGTPCQISGLKHFLRKEYDNLLTCEIFCHSVPSPKVWEFYIEECLNSLGWKKEHIVSIDFRNKCNGWKNYHFQMISSQNEVFNQQSFNNPYMKGFIGGLYTRPSCYDCPAKSLKSGSDFTIGDYWGIQHLKPQIDDDKGVSAVLLNTNKARNIWCQMSGFSCKMDYSSLCVYNPAVIRSAVLSEKRKDFFQSNKKSFNRIINSLCKQPLYWRIRRLLSGIIRRILHMVN